MPMKIFTTSEPIMSEQQLKRLQAAQQAVDNLADGAYHEAREHLFALELCRTELLAIDDEVRSVLGKDHAGGVLGVRALALLAAKKLAKVKK
jgi:hypothetical protein